MAMGFRRGSLVAAVCAALAWMGCGHDANPVPPLVTQPTPAPTPPPAEDAGTPLPDAGTPPPTDDAGTPDAGTPDAGTPDAGTPASDGGTPADGGTADGGTDKVPPLATTLWPTDPVKDYSAAYHLPALRGVSIDPAQNVWLLTTDSRVGVLKPGASAPQFGPSGMGQAGHGFGATCICAGEAGRAYVGYWAPDPESMDERYSDPPFRLENWSAGDVDVVHLDGTGQVALEQHMNLFNSNDHHWNEVQGIFTCTRVMRGAFKNEVYVGSNHAVTRIRGLDYADHRHAVWDVNGSLRIGYNKAVGIAQNGDLMMGNEWKVAMLTPPPDLMDFINFDVTPWRLDTYVAELGSQEDMDFWHAVAQTKDGVGYWGSAGKGLWRADLTVRSDGVRYDARWSRVPGVSSDIEALAATDDGSLFIGTGGSGLWRLKADQTLEQVTVNGGSVVNLVYDPTQTPSMLLVLTTRGLTVLRGY